MVQDFSAQWAQSYPCKTKSSQETDWSLRQFLQPSENPKVNDNSLEFGKLCEDSPWNHRTSTPHRSETNGIAARAVRRIKEGTSAVLLQSGLAEKWLVLWNDVVICEMFKTSWQMGKHFMKNSFGEPVEGPVIPFGLMAEYFPISAKDQSRFHRFGNKVLPGIFLGYALVAEEEPGKEIFGLQTLRS